MATDWTAILLAGGRSSRMGRDKALLDWRGRPLIEHMIGRLRDAGARHVWVSGSRPGYGGIADARPGSGPVGGVAACIRQCPDGAVIVVPVDLPLVNSSRFSALLDALADHPATCFDQHPMPCAFSLDSSVRVRIAGLFDGTSAPSMRALLSAIDAAPLAAGDTADLRPCNTPADYAALAP